MVLQVGGAICPGRACDHVPSLRLPHQLALASGAARRRKDDRGALGPAAQQPQLPAVGARPPLENRGPRAEARRGQGGSPAHGGDAGRENRRDRWLPRAQRGVVWCTC